MSNHRCCEVASSDSRREIFESVTARNAHQGGWTSSLDRLAEYLAKA